MSVRKILSFGVSMVPFVGGGVMILEAGYGKTDLGETKLEGRQKMMHFLFGIITLGIDCFTGVGGSATRVGVKLLSKGFLRRGAVVAAKAAGRGTATRGALRSTARVIGKMENGFVGRRIVGAAENRIRNELKGNSGARSKQEKSRHEKLVDQRSRNNETIPEQQMAA